MRRGDGQRLRVHDVSRVARKPTNDAQVGSLCHTVVDIDRLDGDDSGDRQREALEVAGRLFADGARVHLVDHIAGDRETVFAQCRGWVEKEGTEGVVAHSVLAGWFKIKPRHSLDLAVVGCSEGSMRGPARCTVCWWRWPLAITWR